MKYNNQLFVVVEISRARAWLSTKLCIRIYIRYFMSVKWTMPSFPKCGKMPKMWTISKSCLSVVVFIKFTRSLHSHSHPPAHSMLSLWSLKLCNFRNEKPITREKENKGRERQSTKSTWKLKRLHCYESERMVDERSITWVESELQRSNLYVSYGV